MHCVSITSGIICWRVESSLRIRMDSELTEDTFYIFLPDNLIHLEY